MYYKYILFYARHMQQRTPLPLAAVAIYIWIHEAFFTLARFSHVPEGRGVVGCGDRGNLVQRAPLICASTTHAARL